MIDHDRVVREIRAYLQSPEHEAEPRLAMLAEQYARLTIEVNDRLRRCAAFLKQGLRSEALQLARVPLDLLDVAATLDFPERAEWSELAAHHGWTEAPAIASECLRALQKARAEQDPLRELLRHHRRLALERAPLSLRIQVLRELAAHDPGNPIWVEDLRHLEEARYAEIPNELRQARAEADLKQIELLIDELESPDRKLAAREALVREARATAAQLKREKGAQALDELLPRLHAAFLEKDVVQGRKLRSEWRRWLGAAKLPDGHPLRGFAIEALDWLEAEDRREKTERQSEKKLQNLEQALEGDVSAERLAELEQSALRLAVALPAGLKQQVKERRRLLNRAMRVRQWALLGAIVAGCVALTAAVVRLNAAGARSIAIERAAQRITSALETGNVVEARGVLDELEAGFAHAGEAEALRPVVRKLHAAERTEAERARAFADALDEARAAPLAQESVPALDRARTLARTKSEKDALARLAGARSAQLEGDRTRLEAELQPRLNALVQRLDSLEAQLARRAALHALQAAIGPIRSELEALRDESSQAGEALRERVRRALVRLTVLDTAAAARLDQERLLENLIETAARINTASDVAVYITRCEEFVERFPDDLRARPLRSVLRYHVFWSAAAAWAEIVRSWPSTSLALLPKPAEFRRRQLRPFFTAYPDRPESRISEAYYQAVEAIARRASTDESNPDTALIRLVSHRAIDPNWRLRTRDGRAYYAKKDPDRNDRGCWMDVLLTSDGRERRSYFSEDKIASFGPSPQAIFAARSKPRVVSAMLGSEAAWDVSIVELLEAIRTEPELDPVFKVQLLKGVLSAAVRGSTALQEALAEPVRIVDGTRIDLNAPWLDPDDKVADHERKRARELFASLPSFLPYAPVAEQHRKALESAAARTFWPVGSLQKDAEGAWVCPKHRPMPPDAELFIVADDGVWQKVGRLSADGGKIQLEAAAPILAECQLLFSPARLR